MTSDNPFTRDPGLPTKNPTRSVWLDENPLKNFKSSKNLPRYTDVLVIGSGFSGASIAYHMLVDEKTRIVNPTVSNFTVTMVEAREACGGATGRNGGHIIPDNHRGFLTDSQVFPNRAMDATAVRIFEQISMNQLGRFIKENKIDCEFRAAGNIEVYTDVEEYATAIKSLEEARKWGITGQHILSKKDMQEMLGTTEYVGAIKIPSGQLYPGRLIWFLLNKSIERGLRFYTYTPVVGIEPATSAEVEEAVPQDRRAKGDVFWNVLTENGERIICRDVIHATNAYAGHLLKQYRGRIFPVRAQVISTNPAFMPKLFPFGLSMRGGLEYAMRRDYPNGRLIYGGFRTSSDTLEVGTANDSEINPNLSKALRESFNRAVFSHMGKDERINYDAREWTGIMGFSDDDAPYVGNVYDDEGSLVTGQWILAGLSAHGMPRCFRCGREIARLVGEEYMSSSEIQARKQITGSVHSGSEQLDLNNRLLSEAGFQTNPARRLNPSIWSQNGKNNIDSWDYPLPKFFFSTPNRLSSINTCGWEDRDIMTDVKIKAKM